MILNVFNNPIFITICVIILILIFIISLILIIKKPTIKQTNWFNNINQELTSNNIKYTILKEENNIYDYKLTIDEKIFLIKILYVPSYSEVQINNINTWEIKYGAGKALGKVQPFKKLATNITKFMNYKPNNNEQKIVIICPNAKKITKYINECEIVFVDSKTNVYGAKVINEDDYSLFVKKV